MSAAAIIAGQVEERYRGYTDGYDGHEPLNLLIGWGTYTAGYEQGKADAEAGADYQPPIL